MASQIKTVVAYICDGCGAEVTAPTEKDEDRPDGFHGTVTVLLPADKGGSVDDVPWFAHTKRCIGRAVVEASGIEKNPTPAAAQG